MSAGLEPRRGGIGECGEKAFGDPGQPGPKNEWQLLHEPLEETRARQGSEANPTGAELGQSEAHVTLVSSVSRSQDQTHSDQARDELRCGRGSNPEQPGEVGRPDPWPTLDPLQCGDRLDRAPSCRGDRALLSIAHSECESSE